MSARINANSCKNALGAVFLLATAFFVCSTFISMRSVFADPVAPVNPVNNGAQSGRQSPRSTSRTSNRTISRSTVSRAKTGATVTPVRSTVSRARTGATVTPTRSAVSRANASRTVSSRAVTPSRPNTNVISRGTATRGQSTRATTNNRAVRARAGTSARVSASGNIMSGNIRATTSAQNTMLTSRLNTGNYSNIIDSTTGLISADAYSNCMDAYYTCMDEICTARNAARGRCSCAGRAEKFLDAEEALRRANEELITLSGQLSLLISTKGKGKDLVAAFTLTDAEKVMNCVSWSDAVSVAGSTKDASGKPMSHDAYLKNWCQEHLVYDYEQETCKDSIVITRGSEKGPSYCYEGGNNFGFQLSDLKAGSSSDILAQLKSWAEAKDLAKQYVNSDTGEVVTAVVTINSMLNDLKYGNNQEGTSLDNLANKWGYKLFEYAHNNVCNRVLDSCFNGIFEACGTPISVTDSDEITHSKCQNGAATSCPFNFNSYISVDSEGDVELHERSTTTTTAFSSASCFGYTSASYSGYSGTLATKKSLTSTDPYANLRGPVADARRSIMQKYLLDSNAACDVYGDALTNTAQNINYQKVAAEQALQQKRLEFKQQEDSTTYSNYVTYAENFSTCMDEIWDCYYNFDETWTTARVKTYCAQKSNVPHCYEPMVCAPGDSDFAIEAVIDEFDSGDDNCTFSQDFRSNTCRNLTTISEILHGTGGKAEKVNSTSHTSKDLREKCLVERGAQQIRDWVKNDIHWCDSGQLLVTDENAIKGYNTNSLLTVCQYITECKTGYKPSDNKKSCVAVFTGVVDADTGTGTGDSGGSGGGGS